MLSDSLAFRIGAILLGSFLAAALLIVAVMVWPAGDDGGASLFHLLLPDETIAVVQALEASPEPARPLVLKALNTDVASVHLEPSFPPLPAGMKRAENIEWVFSHYSDVLAGRLFRVEIRDGLMVHALAVLGMGRPSKAVRLLVQLRDGPVLVIAQRPAGLTRGYIARAAWIGGTAALILLLALGLAVRQTARPVARLADAARRFSVDLKSPDLPITGPRELRDLSLAFNDMQSRIRGLVADRTRVIAAIAHDMRTYLTRLRLRADFINDDDQRARAAADIDEMALLLDDTILFVALASGAAPGSEIVDIIAEIDTFVGVRRELGELVEVVAPWPPRRDAKARCSRMAIRRMLGNLADNAVRYGGVALVGAESDADEIRVFVEDRGSGIPAEARALVTEPFQRLEYSRARAKGGAGLGLSIVKALAESCGGTLHLENCNGGGLRATLRLPLAKTAGS